jgi:hypothetical protein
VAALCAVDSKLAMLAASGAQQASAEAFVKDIGAEISEIDVVLAAMKRVYESPMKMRIGGTTAEGSVEWRRTDSRRHRTE